MKRMIAALLLIALLTVPALAHGHGHGARRQCHQPTAASQTVCAVHGADCPAGGYCAACTVHENCPRLQCPSDGTACPVHGAAGCPGPCAA